MNAEYNELARTQSANEITNPILLDVLSHMPNGKTILNEANFGLKHIRPYVETLQDNADILEIGSGCCALLSHLHMQYPALRFTGVEPIGSGFGAFKECLETLKEKIGFCLHENTYESLDAAKKYDLIFLVNVFEHLPDWQGFLKFVKTSLKGGGKCIILCPNYSFPYESHFGIPIIIGKNITHTCFKKTIQAYERNSSALGLWDSLNFVKLRHVCSAAKALGLELHIQTNIVEDLINRVSYDTEFAKRQKVLGRAASMAQVIGLVKLFNFHPFNLLQPYMFLEISTPSFTV